MEETEIGLYEIAIIGIQYVVPQSIQKRGIYDNSYKILQLCQNSLHIRNTVLI